MKSKKLRLLALPLVAAMASGAGIVAGTFAYFTSQDKATVSIEAGQVKISIETSNLKAYSLGVQQTATGTVGEKTVTYFENHGYAYMEGNVIVLDRITPGDKVSFDIKVKNESNVKIKYKYSYAFADEIAGRDRVDDQQKPIYVPTAVDLINNPLVGTKKFSDPTYGVVITENLNDDYVYLDSGAQPAAADTITIELPAERGNETQAAVGKIVITADAIQANAPVAVATEEALVDAINEGKSVELTDDIDLNAVVSFANNATEGVSFDNKTIDIIGNGNTISAPAGSTRAINIDGVENLKLNLVNVEIDSTGKERGVSAYNSPGVEINVVQGQVIANMYAINVASNCPGAVVNIKDATVSTGWCAVQTWSANTIINVEDSTLIGTNDVPYNADGWNNFSTIVVNVSAVDTVLNIKNSKVIATEVGQTVGEEIKYNSQTFLGFRSSSAEFNLAGTVEFEFNGDKSHVLAGLPSADFIEGGIAFTSYEAIEGLESNVFTIDHTTYEATYLHTPVVTETTTGFNFVFNV